MMVSVSGRGSSVSGDRAKSRPQNSRWPSTRPSGSRAATRAPMAAIRACSAALSTRSGRAKTSAADNRKAAASTQRARRRGSSHPPAANPAAVSASAVPIVGPAPTLPRLTARAPPSPARRGGSDVDDRRRPSPSPASGGGLGWGLAGKRTVSDVALLFRRHPELLGAVGGGEPVDHLVERLAGHDLVDLVEGQVDAVVGHPALREVIGADVLRAVARADLALAVGGARRGECLAPHLIEPGAQHLQRAGLVLMLRFLVLLDHHEAGRQMGDPDSAVGGVDRLSARPARTEHVDAQILV